MSFTAKDFVKAITGLSRAKEMSPTGNVVWYSAPAWFGMWPRGSLARWRIYRVLKESRLFSIMREVRGFVVAKEPRDVSVEKELFIITKEDRNADVGSS